MMADRYEDGLNGELVKLDKDTCRRMHDILAAARNEVHALAMSVLLDDAQMGTHYLAVYDRIPLPSRHTTAGFWAGGSIKETVNTYRRR